MTVVRTFTNETAFLTALGAGSTLINFDTDPANTPIPSNTAIDRQYPLSAWSLILSTAGIRKRSTAMTISLSRHLTC